MCTDIIHYEECPDRLGFVSFRFVFVVGSGGTILADIPVNVFCGSIYCLLLPSFVLL